MVRLEALEDPAAAGAGARARDSLVHAAGPLRSGHVAAAAQFLAARPGSAGASLARAGRGGPDTGAPPVAAPTLFGEFHLPVAAGHAALARAAPRPGLAPWRAYVVRGAFVEFRLVGTGVARHCQALPG